MNKFSPREAIEYAGKGLLEEWIHAFLLSEGNNKGLSDGLKKATRYWIGPLEFPLEKLERCCGPEDNMEFKVSEGDWNKKVDKMCSSIKKGWKAPPLILECRKNELSIRDGNHRYEALRRKNCSSYFVIIWCNSKEDFLKFQSGIKL